MEGQKRSWPLKEVIVVVVVIAILVVIGYAMNLDYKKKARTAEVPGALREIVMNQSFFYENPFVGNGHYASTIGSLGWRTAFNAYGDVPEDCNYKNLSGPDMPQKYIKLKEIPASDGWGGWGSADYTWACGKYFAYGASEKNNCSDETVGIHGVGNAFAYAIPTWNIEDYPSDWQVGACMRLGKVGPIPVVGKNIVNPAAREVETALHHK